MTRLILGLLGAVAFTLMGAGPKAEAQQPKRGGVLNFAISAETPHYDCHASDTYATLHFSAPFYSTLLRYNLSKFPEIEGDLAKSWTVAPDKKTYTFRLQEGVKFHDGTTLTSADVKATYDRLRNPPQGVVSTRRATFGDIDTIETPDANTVVFKMKAVNSSMIDHFASPWNCVYAAKDLAADPAAPRTKINGTGPFTFVEHVKGSHVAGKRNENYFKKGLPYLNSYRGNLHAPSGGDAQRAAGRAGAGRVPRRLAGGTRPDGRGHGRQAPGRGIELDAQPDRRLQRREEAVRRRARAQGAAHGDRSLGRQRRPLAHLHLAVGRRRRPSRLAAGDAGGGAREASRLLEGHQRSRGRKRGSCSPKQACRT